MGLLHSSRFALLLLLVPWLSGSVFAQTSNSGFDVKTHHSPNIGINTADDTVVRSISSLYLLYLTTLCQYTVDITLGGQSEFRRDALQECTNLGL